MKELILVVFFTLGALLSAQSPFPTEDPWSDVLSLSVAKIDNNKPDTTITLPSSKCLDGNDNLLYESTWDITFTPSSTVVQDIFDIQPKGLILVTLLDYNLNQIDSTIVICVDENNVTQDGELASFFPVQFNDDLYDEHGLFLAKIEVYLGLPFLTNEADLMAIRDQAEWKKKDFEQHLELRCCYAEVENFSLQENRCINGSDDSGYSYSFDLSNSITTDNVNFSSILLNSELQSVLDEAGDEIIIKSSISPGGQSKSGQKDFTMLEHSEIELIILTSEDLTSCSYLDTVVYTCCQEVSDTALYGDRVWWVESTIHSSDLSNFNFLDAPLGIYSDNSIEISEDISIEEGSNIVFGITPCEFEIEKKANASTIEITHLTIAPNPIEDEIRIRTRLVGNLVVQVLDIQNNVVVQKNIQRLEDSNDIKLDATKIHCGFYIVFVSNGEEASLAKMIKI